MVQDTHEQTINTALGEVLGELGKSWIVRAERIGRTFEEGGRPDILILNPGGWPIVVEAEVGNHRQAEDEARSRLRRRLASSAATIDSAVALVYPSELRGHHGQALREALQSAIFEYALFSTEGDGSVSRVPASGWLTGDLRTLALFLHRSSLPAWRVETLATALQHGIERAAGTLAVSHPIGSPVGHQVAAVLDQADDREGQTRKMAMTVVVNALIFHAALAEAGMEVIEREGATPRPVRPPTDFRRSRRFLPTTPPR